MVCSAKELGLSDDHEGIMLLEGHLTRQPGTPLVDVLGDVIFDIDLTPNMARAYSVLGVAREVAALTGQTVREPSYDYVATGGPVDSCFQDRDSQPAAQPAFHCGMLIRDVDNQALAAVDAAPPGSGRRARDQQHRGRDQLRHVRDRAAAARL